MAKRTQAHGLLAACVLMATTAGAEEIAAGGVSQAGGDVAVDASAGLSVDPAADAAAQAGPPAPAAPPADRRTFWEIVGEDNPNPATYEIGFVGIGLNKSWGISNWGGGGFYFGAGGGIGSNLYRVSKMGDQDVGIDPTLEIVYGNLFFRLTPIEYVDLDVGGRIALGAATYNVTDAPRGGFVSGPYGDLRIGSSKVKLGPRFEFNNIQYSDYTETGWKITPLMLRVVND